VPEQYQMRLLDLRDKFREGYFEIGDIANELTDYATASGFKVTKKMVHTAVGSFCGKSERTVRYYAETAEFYPKDVRDEYDVLSFAHFVFAKSLGQLWCEPLKYAKIKPWVSVSALEARFARRYDGISVIKQCSDGTMMVVDNADETDIEDESFVDVICAPKDNALMISDVLTSISAIVDRVNRILGSGSLNLPIEPNLRQEIVDTLAKLSKLISKINM